MLIKLSSPVRSMIGTYATSDLVFYEQQGLTYARARVTPANPQSPDQQKVRSYLTSAVRNWDELTATQRDAWELYAKTYYTETEDGQTQIPQGLNVYVKLNSVRQTLGLTLLADAPAEAPPTPLSAIAQPAGQAPDGLVITVTHSIPVVTGLEVLVRMTPAMSTVARSPKPGDYRYVQGVGAASSAALPASGAGVTFGPTRFIVNDGQRYGVEARVVRPADGSVSRPVYGDFIKAV